MTDKLQKLKAQRGVAKSELTRFENYLKSFDPHKSSIVALQSRLEVISNNSLTNFNLIQEQIEDILITDDSFDEEACSRERDEFETKYFDLIAFAKQTIEQLTTSQIPVVSTSITQSSQPQILSNINTKLPPLKLVEFSGSYCDWRKFFDTFNALVHNNNVLSNVEKFYYLQASLKGDAAQVVASLPITDSNYATAWKLLTDRYENSKAITNAHIREIVELPSIPKESHINIRSFLDNFLKNYRALELIDNDVTSWNAILIYLLIKKLDFNTRREWENCVSNIAKPDISDFTSFLSQRCAILESLPAQSTFANTSKKIGEKLCHLTLDSSHPASCLVCEENHPIYYCQQFKKMPVATRFEKIKSLRCCINCLRSGHRSNECKSSSCRVCGQRHSTLLHRNNKDHKSQHKNEFNDSNLNQASTSTQSNHNQGNNASPISSNNTILAHYSQNNEPFILLSTAVIHVFDINQQPIKCRIILDSGSQANFVTYDLANKLKLPMSSIELPVCGINQVTTNITKKVNITISSSNNDHKMKLLFLVIDKISNLTPQFSFDLPFNIPQNIQLADPHFNLAQNVDMIIGAEIFYDLLCIGQIKLGKNHPILQKSRFGWIISGQIMLPQNSPVTNSFSANLDLSHQIEKFWTVEEGINESIGNPILTKEEMDCENHFVENLSRHETGRFIVKLPLKDNYMDLGESKRRALHRLYSIERNLSQKPELRESYIKFMHEYQSLGHMNEIEPSSTNNSIIFYLPHHGVEKPESTSTKLRVVFDGSAKTSTNLSLNNILKVGPTVQQDLFSILLRFRKHPFVLIGDITKMYRQILIHPEDRNLQRIVWRDNPEQNVKTFILNTVTYGTASAAFLATRCIKQIAIESRTEYPSESSVIQNDFYVDDLLTGSESVEALATLKQNISEILSNYGFELTKFKSNDPRVLSNLNLNQSSEYIINDDSSIKTLGISWLPSRDCFEYKVQAFFGDNTKFTKRSILSFIAKIFDPLGLLGPIVIRLKILIQRLWELHIDWDESLPIELFTGWVEFTKQLNHIHTITIPRHVILQNPQIIEIHGFADASEKAYACSIYLRAINNDKISCNLLCAKTRVAPIKSLPIPRLELCGAVLLVRLLNKCLPALDMEINNIYLWTDSTIVLSWLSCESKTWKTFVSNRISEIQQSTQRHNIFWNHISSNENPSDVLSRGTNLTELINHDLYWHGPCFLKGSYSGWPKNDILKFARNPSELPDYKPQKILSFFTENQLKCDIFERFSDLNKLITTTAFCFRFIQNCKSAIGERNLNNKLTNTEFNDAKTFLIKLAQTQSFSHDLLRLSKKPEVSKSSPLKSLSPFLDSSGIIRVGGRLKNSELSYNQRHQILLPQNHALTKLIIDYEHRRSLHSGIQGTLSHIRQTFWPINCKSAVKEHVRKCLKCFKANPPLNFNKMGNLPSVRVTISKPFLSCGVDYAGTFDLKDGKTRNRKIIKGYICVFICMATKALHLELITDLTAEGFASLLKRFVSRRGLPTDIFSDNGTNFVGFHNKLEALKSIIQSEHFQHYLNVTQINWHFIPSRSPHFGGLWEAAVKSVKHHLRRLLTNNPLTYEEFYTLIIQIEGVLNSRPLTPMSQDPNDLQILTPAHFLIGQSIAAVPERDLTTKLTPINHVKRYEYVQRMMQHMWHRWSNDYLHNLQQRTKWMFDKTPAQASVGSMVIIREENLPPSQWMLGRIVEVFPGDDNRVRVVSVKTRTGLLKRTINKICILPFSGNQEGNKTA